MKKIPGDDVYCTSFCNHGHQLSNGHPVNHECYILKPEALSLERRGMIEAAQIMGIRTDRILSPRKVEVV
jgi:hypothetical protein